MNTCLRIIIGIVLLFSGTVASAQAFTNKGTEFWVGYGHHQFMENGSNTMNLVLYLSAEQAANVTVRIWGSSTPFQPAGYVKTYSIAANTVIQTENMPKGGTDAGPSGSNPNFDARLFDYPTPIGTGGEGLWQKKGIQITSDVPIVAYAHIWGSASSGATMLMPVHTWGYSYTAVNSKQVYASDCYSWMYVVAKDDNTKVRITPSVVTKKGKPANVPFEVTLNKGEMYQIIGQTTGSTGLELTGTTVESISFSGSDCPKPIAVFSGSSRTTNPASCGSNGGDNDNQQLFPHQAWGTKFLTAPTSSASNPASFGINTYKVVIKEAGTVVTRNGVTLTGLSQNHYVFESNTADLIESNKPIMVAQFMTGGAACLGGNSLGDPEMIIISPVEQASKKVAFFRNNRQGISTNYFTMIIPTAGLPSLKIDGSNSYDHSYAHPRQAGYSVVIKRWNGFAAFPAPPPGQCVVQSDYPFTAITYGLGSVESYGYNAGTNIINLNGISEIDNVFDSVNTFNEYTCRKTPIKISAWIAYQPTNLLWKLSNLSSVLSPAVDVNQSAPVSVGTKVINGITYYKYDLPGEYIFSQPGLFYLPVIATSPTVGSCTKTEELSLEFMVKESPVTDFTYVQTSSCGNQVSFTSPSTAAVGFTLKNWRWSFPDGTKDSTQNPVKSFAAAGTYAVYHKIVSSEGCVGDTTKNVIVTSSTTNPLTATAANGTICEGASTTLTAAGGTTYTWSPATGLSATTGATVTANPTTTTTYTVTSDVSGCSYAQTVTVTVVPKPVAPTVTTPVDYCQGATATPLTATGAAGNTLTWYTNAGLTGGSTTAPTPSTATAGTTTYWVTQKTAEGCEGPSALIDVIVQAAIAGNDNVGPAQVICGGTAPNSIGSAASPTGGSGAYTYQWEESTDGGTTWTAISGATSANFNPPAATGSIKYRRVVTSGLCTNTSNIVTVTVQGSLTGINISADQTICQGTMPVLLLGEQPSGGDGSFAFQWESSTDNSTWTAIGTATGKDYQPGMLADTMYFRRKVTSGICTGTSNVVQINVNAQPNGTIAGPAAVCEYDTYSINFSASVGTPPFNLSLTVTGPGGYNTTLTPTITGMGPAPIAILPANSTPGNYTVTFNSITDSYNCSRNSGLAPVNFTVNPKPVLAVSPNAAICNGSSTTLTVTGASTYSWSPATGLSGTTGASVTANPTATTTYTIVGTASGCEATATVTVTVNPVPAKPTVTTPVTYCQNGTATALSASGAAGNTITWYTNAGLTGGTTTAPTPSTATAGNTTYYVTQTTPENCRSEAETITVTVQPSITGNVISADQTICQGGTLNDIIQSGSLNGGNSAFTYGWEQSSDNGATWTTVSGATTSSLTPSAAAGTMKYRRMVNSGECTSTSNVVTITVHPALTNLAVNSAQTICEGTAPALLDGQAAAGGTGAYTYEWMSSADGTNWTTIGGATGEDYQPGALTANTYYRRKVTSGPCSEFSASVLITVDPKPNGTLTPSTVCKYDPASVGFTSSAGTAPYTVVLTISGPGGYSNTITQSVSSTATIPVLPANSTAGSYTVTFTSITDSKGCVRNSGLTNTTITVNPEPAVTVTPDASICAGGNTTLTAGGATTYSWSPATGLSSPTGATVTASPSATTTYTVTGTSNGCTATATVTVTVNPVPAKPTVTSPVSYCQNDAAVQLSATAAAGNTLTWYNNPGLTGGSGTAPTPSTGTAGSFNFYVTQTNSFNCTSQAEVIAVTIQPAISGNTISADQLLCSGSSANPIGSATAPTGGNNTYTYQWQQSTDGGANWSNISGATSMSYSPGALANTTQYRRNVVSGMCSSTSNVVTVSVQGAVSNTGITGSQSVCYGSVPAMLDGQPATGVTYQWQQSADLSTWTNIAGATYEDYQPSALTATTHYRRQVSNGACSSVSGTVTVTVNALPNGALTGVTVCEYDPASVSFASSAGQAPYNLQLNITGPGGYNNTINTSMASTGSIPVLPANSAPGTYTVNFTSITDNNGCVKNSGLSPVSIVVNPKPVLSVPTTVPACQGTSTTLTVSGASTYTWSPATGLNTTSGATVIANPSATTTYTVTGVSNGCSSTANVTVTVNPRPTASFTVDNDVCQNSNATFVPATTSGNVTSWKWDFGDGTGVQTYNDGYSFTRSYATASTFNVKLVTVDANGCVSDTARQTITVRPLPAADFTMPGSICLPNGVANFTNTSTIADNSAMTWSWDLGDQSAPVTVKDPSHVYPANGPYNVTLTATSAYGCVNVMSKLLGSEVFFAKPVAQFDVAPEALCQGMDNVFTDMSTAANSSIKTWNWNFDDGTASNKKDPVKRYKSPGVYEVSLVVKNAEGCVSDTAWKEVTVYLQPVVDAGPSFVVTLGTIVNFQPKVNDSTINFMWTPAADFSDPTKLRQTIVAQKDQTYTLTAIGEGGCTASDDLVIKILNPVKIPNAFSPNGDGINDTWEIPYLKDYPGATVQIFNRYGQQVYFSYSYGRPWDGRYNGNPLPVATYYYIVTLENGFAPISGSVTIVK